MKSVDLIIWDLDGTLIDSSEDIANGGNFMLKTLGLKEKSRAEIAECVGKGVQNLVLGLLGKEHEDKFDQALKILKKRYSEHLLDHTKLYPGILDTLEHFKNKKQAVITNKPEGFSRTILKGLGIEKYFSILIGGDTVRTKKPSPEGVFKVLADLKIPAERAVLIGDSSIDIETARNAKIPICAVTYGFGKLEEIRSSKPDFLIDKISLLASLIA